MKYIKRILCKIQWKYRSIMLHIHGANVKQTKDLKGVVFTTGKRKGEYVSYGKQYSNLYFQGYIIR